MTVLENALTGLHAWLRPGVLPARLLRLPGFQPARARGGGPGAGRARSRGAGCMRPNRPAGTLPYGDQRRLEIARAMAPGPPLLLLDEPAAGMNPAETEALGGLIRRIRDAGTTVLLVEHDMGFVMGLSDRVAVLNFGRLIADGAPERVRRGSGGDRSLSWAQGCGPAGRGRASLGCAGPDMTGLRVEGLAVFYGRTEAVRAHFARCARGADRVPDRGEWRRQDERHAGVIRAGAAAGGADRLWRPRYHGCCAASRGSAWGCARFRKDGRFSPG